MEREIWIIVKAFLFDRRVILPFFLLLTIVFLVHPLLHHIFSELDIFEHFLFGFVLSEFVSKSTNALGLDKNLDERLSRGSGQHVDLLIRLLGFLLIGGLLWELTERFIFPMFGAPYSPFFTLPITLHNIDGTIDIIVGALGCTMAWYTARGSNGVNRD